MTAETLLRLESFVAGYPGRELTSPLSAEIPVGVRVGLIGANGSGKSTVVKTLLGLVKPLSGHYEWRAGARFGYVPQENQLDELFPLTVDDLLKMGTTEKLPRLRSASADFEREAGRTLKELEIEPLRSSLVRELSGGQRQRALIARALIARPDVLVMDEPYSFLDHLFNKKLRERFQAWSAKEGLSVFLVEHDLNLMLNHLDRSRDWLMILGREKTLCGPISEVLTEKALSEAYGTTVHLHKENGETQVHLL
jgi:ABC-type Mn2+/Zn2+ transport system ATPase subunit